MRVRRPVAEELTLLVEFLNWKGTRPSKTSDLYRLVDDFGLQKSDFVEGVTKEKLTEAQQLKDEIIKDLAPLISGEGGKPWRHLDDLVDKINGLGLKPHWKIHFGNQKVIEAQFQMTPWPRYVAGTGRKITNPAHQHLGPDQRILSLHGTTWIIRRRYPETARVRERLYWTIISALENGELAGLRMCPTCKTYFLASDLKRRFCKQRGQRCKDEFFNLEKARAGYFKRNRNKKKRERLNKARKLLDTGKSEQSVMEELGLTRKALERAGLI